MKKTEPRLDAAAECGVIDLGAASDETRGIPDALTVESFQARPPADELSAD